MENHKDQQIKIQQLSENLEDLEIYLNEFNTFLPLAVCILNPVGIIINVNKAFDNLTGYNNLEILSRHIQEIFKENINDLLKDVQTKVQETKELTLISKDKKEILVNASFSIRKDKEGNFIGYFVGITDITELKKLQEELEKKVEERTKQLQERVNELEMFQKLTIGRELKMIELKESLQKAQQEIKKLKEELEKYKNLNKNE